MTVVCIAGMHRSGTSMITRMLNLCGLFLGEEQDLMPPHPDNPEGYWENRKFVEINDEILSFLGGTWHIPPDPDTLFSKGHDVSFLEEQARNLFGDFADKSFWGWKDPRSSLTLPFWQRLLPDLKVIICLRNPVEVVQSLARRDHFSEIFGFNLWQVYNQRLMTSVAPENRLITHYNIYFENPETELRRLLEFINIKVDDSIIRNACQTTSSSLKRNQATFGNLIETGAPLGVVNLYAEMCSQAGQSYLDIINKTDIQLFSQNVKYFDREVEQELLSKFMEKDPLAQSMTEWVAGKQRQIELLSEQTTELKVQLTEREQSHIALLAEKEQEVQSLTAILAEREQTIVFLKQQINEILVSKAWKTVLLFRRILAVIAPPNSHRARILEQFKNNIFVSDKKTGRNLKLIRVLLEVLKNPRASKTAQLISQSIRLVKENLFFVNSGQQGINAAASETVLDELEFQRTRAFQIVPYYLDPCSTVEVNASQATPKVAVHLHLYYRDMLDQCAEYLNNIPFSFDLYVSASDKNDPDEIATFLKNHIHLLNKVVVKITPNRGRDLAPLIVDFGKNLLNYDFVAHIHTKKSPHSPHLDSWFEDIMDTLLGSKSSVHQIFNLLSEDAKFVYPAPNEKVLIDKSGWGDNYDLAKKLLPQLLGKKIDAYPLVEFPQGSMFWAKSSSLSKFLRLPLTFTDFPSEPIPADGTILHVLERLLLISANHLPGRNYRIYLSKSTIKEAYYESQRDYSHSQVHKTVKVLSYYLPQFYPTPENDEWHGKGFTEWSKVRGANPLFFGHYQQRIPHDDIGYYSLTSTEMLKKQVELMKCSGVYGQIFYHYWFTGKLILENPAQMLLADKSIEMPFCFCWANENWTRKWDGNENEILLGQEYSEQDAVQFINYLIPFFKDERYIKIEGRPVLYIYRPVSIPDFAIYKKVWEKVCAENGIMAPFVVAVLTRGAKSPTEHDMDAGCERVLHDWTDGNVIELKNKVYPYWPINGSVLSYDKVADYYMCRPPIADFTYFRSIIPSWDNTPRYGSEAFVIHKSTPEKFQEWLEKLIADAEERLSEDRRFVVVNAWNEWAESAVLEPDGRFGYAYLNSIGRALSDIRFNDREYLHQVIPETMQVAISLHESLLKELQIDEGLRKKMFFCIANSTVFSFCNIIFEQPMVAQWMSDFLSVSNRNEKNIHSDYTLHIKEACYLMPDTIENMLRMALSYDAGLITPTHLNDPNFTHQHLLGRWETIRISSYMFLLKNGDKRSTKCCVDARIFISQPHSLLKIPKQRVSTIIRFSQLGDMKLLQNALYSLMAQIGCAVQPIIAAQDLTDDMLVDLDAMLKKMSWDDNCYPVIRKYYSTEKNRDLRSLMINDSLKSVKTEYAAILDYDDVMFHTAYSVLIDRLRNTGKNASFGLIYSTVFNSAENKIRERQVVYNYGKSYADFLKLNHTPIHGFLLNMSKINLDQIKYYEDMKYMEDYFLTLQIFTEDGTDWKSLQERKFVGDYYHYEDKVQTLAILNQEQRNKLLSLPDYVKCEDRINEMRYRILHGMPHGKM